MPNGVVRSEHGLIRNRRGRDMLSTTGRAAHPAGIAKAAAHHEAHADVVAGQQGQHVGLVVVEKAKGLARMIAALAARQGIGRPAEEALEQFLPEQDLKSAHLAGSILGQCLSTGGDGLALRENQVVQLLVEAHRLQGQGWTQLEREPAGQVYGI